MPFDFNNCFRCLIVTNVLSTHFYHAYSIKVLCENSTIYCLRENYFEDLITGDTYDIRSKDVLSKLGWNNLEERRNSQTISYVNKALQKNCPEGITEMFQFSCNDNHNLRSNNLMLRLAKPKTNAMKKSFSYAAANIWNSQSISERK